MPPLVAFAWDNGRSSFLKRKLNVPYKRKDGSPKKPWVGQKIVAGQSKRATFATKQEAKVWDMLRLVSYAHGIGLDITTKNMTEIGLNEYKELMRKREEKQEETGQVIRFPGT